MNSILLLIGLLLWHQIDAKTGEKCANLEQAFLSVVDTESTTDAKEVSR
jgi:hypothetical protein